MSWTLIVNALIAVLANSRVPAWVLALLKDWLGGLQVAPKLMTADAPDGLKSWLKEFLAEQVAKVDRPFVRLILTRLVAGLTDDLLDAVWDRLFPSGVVKVAAVPAFGEDFYALADAALSDDPRLAA